MRPSIGVLVAVAIVFVVGSPVDAADPVVRHEGKTIDEWIVQLGSTPERSRDAMFALGRARFVVGAAQKVVPAMEEIVPGEGVDVLMALRNLRLYGPLAARSEPLLAAHREVLGEFLVTRIMVGRDPAPLLDALAKRMEDARADYLAGPTAEKAHDLRLLVDLVSELGYRGDSAATFLRGLLEDERTRPVVAFVTVQASQRLGPLSSPFAGVVVPYLADKDALTRAQAAMALSWMGGLAADHEKALFKAATGYASGRFALPILKGIVLNPAHPAGATIALLRGRAGSGDAALSAWSNAGLARRLADPDRARLVPALLASLKHADPEARAGAATGLLAIPSLDASVVAALSASLNDPDLRVRWRIAAILLRHGQQADAALEELGRGIDGPDDGDRIAAFEAIAGLGPSASSLAERVEPWASVPFPRIAEPAKAALAAIRPK